jgi:serine/threonine-protein kinase
MLNGRYRVGSVLGRGGMAQVFKGTDTVLNRPVAIKVLSPQFAEDASFVHRFRREAQAAARMSHPNIVGIYDTGSDDGTHYIVMEYIEGRTLADFLAGGGRLMPSRAFELGEAVCGALAYAHASGVVHRDIKPGNIMVTRGGEVKVMDFGIARVTSNETVTQTATVLGTASYLSPEQAQGQPVDERSDLYSLGVVLYEMLTGVPPFQGDSAVAVAYKHVQEQPTPPSRLNPEVTPEMDQVVMRALAKNPANRYGSAHELRDDLQRARTGQRVQATPLLAGPAGGQTAVISRAEPERTAALPPTEAYEGYPPEEPRRRWWIGALVGLLILAVLGLGLWAFANSILGDGGDTVEMPELYLLPLDEARQILDDLGLEAEIRRRPADNAPPNTVLDQDPLPGTEVEVGSTVTLFVSRGQVQFEVPNVVGLTEDEAVAAIESAGLVVGERTTQPSEEPEGTVISQDPAAGEQVPGGSEVNLVVSSGPEITTVVVPDVVCFTFAEAARELRDLGLVVEQAGQEPSNPACPAPNRVVRQEPVAGTEVETGTSVRLWTGTPATPTTPPGDGGDG